MEQETQTCVFFGEILLNEFLSVTGLARVLCDILRVVWACLFLYVLKKKLKEKNFLNEL
jgi:hypothetical protein